jgi:hypothetical protein
MITRSNRIRLEGELDEAIGWGKLDTLAAQRFARDVARLAGHARGEEPGTGRRQRLVMLAQAAGADPLHRVHRRIPEERDGIAGQEEVHLVAVCPGGACHEEGKGGASWMLRTGGEVDQQAAHRRSP